MDFSLGSMGVYSNNVGADEITWASMTSDMADSRHQQQQRMQLLSDSAIAASATADHGLISSSSLKQRRSATDLGSSTDPRDDCNIGPLKLVRTDHHSFSNRSQPDLSVSLPPLRNSSMPCSPSTPRISDDNALLSVDSSLVTDSRLQLLRGEHAAYIMAGSQSAPPRYFPSFQHDSYVQQHRPTSGLPMMMGRGGLVHAGAREADVMDGRQFFTSAQWTELEHQALIYKYIMHGAPVPPELLLPLRKSLATSISSISLSSHNLGSVGWGSFQLGMSGNVDPEPGRCRRTDGKKWRCARPVVAEQKYCERHMHRGRHRKKAAEAAAAAAAALSPSPSTNAAPPQSSRKEDISHNFPISHSQLKPSSIPISSHHPGHDTNPNLSAQTLAASGGISIGTTTSRFPTPLHSASSLPSNKDSRFPSGLDKAQFGLSQDQFASEFTPSIHGLVDHLHFSTAMPSTQHLPWHVQQSSKFPPSASLKSNNSWFQPNSDADITSFQRSHEEMAIMANARKLNTLLSHRQQQQHRQSRPPSVFSTEALEDDSKSQGQPLRHFFDDWPRTRDSSTLSWPDADEEKLKVDALSPQLSISIPVNSSEISASDRPAQEKALFSPISLSTLRNADDIADPTHMGLGINSSHRQASWFPRALEDAVGGPLAEALQSGAPHSGEKTNESFVKEEWDNNPLDAPHITSPTGVLQKVTLGTCFSDCSSNASSPGSVRTEHANAENQRLAPVLTNCSSRLST